MRRLAFAAVLLASLLSPEVARGQTVAPPQSAAAIPFFSHVFLIVMENHDLPGVLADRAAPTFRGLASQGAVAENYYGVAHPSEPNYLALIAGDTFGVADDRTDRLLDGPTLVDSLEAANHTWRAYMEGLPASGSTVPAAGAFPADYAKKHNPFMFFSGIVSRPDRTSNVVPLSRFDSDSALGQQPDFSFIVPNECNDIHSCDVSAGDAFLGRMVAAIQASPAWDASSVLFITFDEGSGNASCCGLRTGGGRVGTIVLSPLAVAGSTSERPYNHYSLLRTVEDAWGLPRLGHSGDAAVSPMSDVFARMG